MLSSRCCHQEEDAGAPGPTPPRSGTDLTPRYHRDLSIKNGSLKIWQIAPRIDREAHVSTICRGDQKALNPRLCLLPVARAGVEALGRDGVRCSVSESWSEARSFRTDLESDCGRVLPGCCIGKFAALEVHRLHEMMGLSRDFETFTVPMVSILPSGCWSWKSTRKYLSRHNTEASLNHAEQRDLPFNCSSSFNSRQ
ncbi:uncharacterized protein LOC134347983 isoform X2 [Mobula hypostoma]|uniref:uncharacterized protein LOC134347983 isoform X2 n=1 Tax=Mobula hypostoma TaxID=723540 RepID=UPI002FC3A660